LCGEDNGTEIKRLLMNITKEIWKGDKEDMEKLLHCYNKQHGRKTEYKQQRNQVSKSGQIDKNDSRTQEKNKMRDE
jgi:hypothetical protein